MPRSEHILACLVTMCGVLIFAAPVGSATSEKMKNSCVECHSQLTGDSFVGAKSHAWKGSVHQRRGVTCEKCHGGNPGASGQKEAHSGVLGSRSAQSPVYYKNIPSTCGKCHGAEFYKFTQSFHYRKLESAGKGPDCVTCHGSMVTTVLAPDTVEAVCERCHNERLGVLPYIPKKAKAVLLLLRESDTLVEAEKKLHRPAPGSEKDRALRDAEAALHSAKLDWHKFDLDTITNHLQGLYHSLMKLSAEPPRK